MSGVTYVVGLPVLVTIDAAGQVTYDVDTSEASDATGDAWDEWTADDQRPTEDQLAMHRAAIDADHERRHQGPLEVIFMAYLEDDECEGHESTDGPIGNVTFCDATCRPDPTPGGLGVLLAACCPWKGCTGTEFYEVDRSERWNEATLTEQPATITVWASVQAFHDTVTRAPNPLAGLPAFDIIQRDGDYETIGWICQSCNNDVVLPDYLETSWG